MENTEKRTVMTMICFFEIIFSVYYNALIIAIQFKAYLGDMSIFLFINNALSAFFLLFWVQKYRLYSKDTI